MPINQGFFVYFISQQEVTLVNTCRHLCNPLILKPFEPIFSPIKCQSGINQLMTVGAASNINYSLKMCKSLMVAKGVSQFSKTDWRMTTDEWKPSIKCQGSNTCIGVLCNKWHCSVVYEEIYQEVNHEISYRYGILYYINITSPNLERIAPLVLFIVFWGELNYIYREKSGWISPSLSNILLH